MEIYDPSPAELALFREAAQKPVLKFIREQVGDKLVDDLLKASDVSLKGAGLYPVTNKRRGIGKADSPMPRKIRRPAIKTLIESMKR